MHLKFEVSFAQAALGGEVLVPTKSGFRTLTLPRGTQSGRIFRIPGAGVPASAEGAAGDQVIEVVVNTPAVLSPDQRTLLEEFRRLERPEMSWAAHE